MSINKYLSHYAEPEAHSCDYKKIIKKYNYALIIPAYNESIEFIDRLFGNEFISDQFLLIVVINQPPNQKSDTNTCLFQKIKQYFKTHIDLSSSISWHHCNQHNRGILIIDRFSENPIPIKKGVGLARKIAADIALACINHNIIKNPWIFCTDADTHLPKNYFSIIHKRKTNYSAGLNQHTTSALLYPFTHESNDDSLQAASHYYEGFLKHYVKGLQYAESPYAYHSIGSTIAIDASSYAKVRGFPKRSAGEDFYILNKLAKYGAIKCLNNPIINIEARLSDRTPFGTGPAIQSILEYSAIEEEYLLYDKKVFHYLKLWLKAFPHIWNNISEHEKLSSEQLDKLLIKSLNKIDPDQNIANIIYQCITQLGIQAAIAHSMKHSKDYPSFELHLHTWFDAFRTLKFIHYLRDHHFPSISYKKAINSFL